MTYVSFAKRTLLGTCLAFMGACLATPEDLAEEQAVPTTVGRSQAALVSTCDAQTPIDPFKELFIVDPSVVDSSEARNDTLPAGGELSFRHTMTTLAGGEDVAAFTERFLQTWKSTHTVGQSTLEVRQGVDQLLTGGLWRRTADGKLDMSRAPFRLLGIANRMDLFGTDARKPHGEARLIYGLIAPGPGGVFDPVTSSGLPLTIIFEFNLPRTHSLRGWAERWHALGAVPFGSSSTGMNASSFNRTLFQTVVSEFVAPENLSQVRTNEVFFSNTWQLREFHLVNGSLVNTTTKQSPEPLLNDTPELIQWVKANQKLILSNLHVVPATLLGARSNQGFPGGGRGMSTFENTRWLVNSAATSGIPEAVRAAFARETCNGCHNSETNNGSEVLQTFYQVSPNGPAGTDRLSPFIKNKELPLRQRVLSGLLSCGCVASYQIDSSWAEGSTSSVRITNIGSAPVSSWKVQWTYPSNEVVTSNWESKRVQGVSAPSFAFENLAWNGALAPGASVQFGFNTSFTGLAPAPGELSVDCQ